MFHRPSFDIENRSLEGPFFKNLQTPVDVCRQLIGAGNERVLHHAGAGTLEGRAGGQDTHVGGWRVLVADRFDVDEHGLSIHGVEDIWSLLGVPPHEKYATTIERVLNATRVYVPAAIVRGSVMEIVMFKQRMHQQIQDWQIASSPTPETQQ